MKPHIALSALLALYSCSDAPSDAPQVPPNAGPSEELVEQDSAYRADLVEYRHLNPEEQGVRRNDYGLDLIMLGYPVEFFHETNGRKVVVVENDRTAIVFGYLEEECVRVELDHSYSLLSRVTDTLEQERIEAELKAGPFVPIERVWFQ